jgi:hypothetical protein
MSRYPGLPFRYRDSVRVRVSGPGYLAPGTRYRIDAEDRIPGTEDRAKRAHRVCILYPTSIIPMSGSPARPYSHPHRLPRVRPGPVLPRWRSSSASGTRSQAGGAAGEQGGEEPAECDVDPEVEPDECSEGLAGIRKPEVLRMEVYKEASHPWTPTTSSLSAPLNPTSSTTEGVRCSTSY